MKTLSFALRNLREILRDKLTVIFGLGFPLVILGLLTLIQSNIPVALFTPESLTPGILVFGLSFISLFSAQLIARDRSTSLMLRLMVSPMTSRQFIVGYLLPLLPLALAQMLVCIAAAVLLGLPLNGQTLLLPFVCLPCSVVFIALGLLCGSLMNDKQVGGICGALLTNVSAWLSGTWFSLELMGGAFKHIAFALPFARAVEAGRSLLSGQSAQIGSHLIWVIGWAIALLVLAILAFRWQMGRDK